MSLSVPLEAVRPRPYVPAAPGPDWFAGLVVDNCVAYLSGQVPFDATGQLVATGRLGVEVDVDTGYRCARQCAVNLLGVLDRALGGLDAVRCLLKLTVFVASAPDFPDQPLVAHGASELLYEVLGERGRHARSAIGVAALPLGCPVEVELTAALHSGSKSSGANLMPSSH